MQNSWGTHWTPNGTGLFYASYEDIYVGKADVVAFDLEAKGVYSDYVLQNELGPLEFTAADANILGMGTLKAESTGSTNIAASVLSVTEPTTLVAIGLASLVSQTSAEISFYLGWDGGLGPVDPVGSSLNVKFGETGYQMFDLDTPITLSADSMLIVVVDYEDGANVIPFVLRGNGVEPVASGLSYYWNATDETWVDFGEMWNGVFFLKGITAVPEPGTGLLIIIAVVGLVWTHHRRTTTSG